MKNNIKNGVFPAMVTPYTKDGTIDFGAVERLTEWYWKNGCAGVFAACQSSEIFFLNLAERISLTRSVVNKANELAKIDKSRERLQVVVSGHVSDSFDAQVEELMRIADTGADAVILITNRFDIENTSEEKWCADVDRLLSKLDSNIKLGLYECPTPYKRLLTDNMLMHCANKGRFMFMKDACCDDAILTRRLKLLSNTNLKLFNANAQTLLASMRNGASGYCGIMANFHPIIYNWICEKFFTDPKLADKIDGFISMSAFTECLNYPVTAKYSLSKHADIPMELESRSKVISFLPEYDKMVIDKMHIMAMEYTKLIQK